MPTHRYNSKANRPHKLGRWLLALLVLALAVAAFAVEFYGGQHGIPTWGQLHSLLGVETGAPDAALLQSSPTTVTVLDVGQASATLIGQDGEYCLIDTGTYDTRDTLVADLQQAGVERLKLLVLTHPHADHIGGAAEILDQFPVEQLLLTSLEPLPAGSGWQDNILERAARCQIPTAVPKAGQAYPLGSGTLTVLQLNHQTADVDDDAAMNDTSICARFTAGDFACIVTGDAETAAEQALVDAYAGGLQSQLLIAGHHGSSTSSTEVFLQAVRPQMAAISCGLNNDYGHPHQATLRRLAAVNAEVYRTDTMGTLTFTYQNGALQATTTQTPTALTPAA